MSSLFETSHVHPNDIHISSSLLLFASATTRAYGPLSGAAAQTCPAAAQQLRALRAQSQSPTDLRLSSQSVRFTPRNGVKGALRLGPWSSFRLRFAVTETLTNPNTTRRPRSLQAGPRCSDRRTPIEWQSASPPMSKLVSSAISLPQVLSGSVSLFLLCRASRHAVPPDQCCPPPVARRGVCEGPVCCFRFPPSAPGRRFGLRPQHDACATNDPDADTELRYVEAIISSGFRSATLKASSV